MGRQNFLRLGLIVAVLLGGIALPASVAQACSCAVLSPAEHLKNADAVFVGTVVEKMKGEQPSDGALVGAGRVVYTVEVDTVYKGEVPAVQQVVSNGNSAACGISLPVGEPVVVFGTDSGDQEAAQQNGQLFTHLCSGTGRGTAPAEFGAGEPPIGEVQPVTQSSESAADPATNWTVPGIIAVVLVLLSGALFLRAFGTRGDATTER
jgi:hypothetical protein